MILQTMASFDPFALQDSPKGEPAVSLSGLIQKQEAFVDKHDDDEDETRSTRSSSVMSISKKAKVVVVEAKEAQSIFGEAFGNHDFLVRPLQDPEDEDIDSLGVESTERSLDCEEGDSSSSSGKGAFEKSYSSAFEIYSSGSEIRSKSQKIPNFPSSPVHHTAQENAGKEKVVPVQPSTQRTQSVTQEPSFPSEPAPSRDPSVSPLRRGHSSTGDFQTLRSAHGENRRGRSPQGRPRPAGASQTVRGIRTTGGPLTEEEGEAFRGNFTQKIRQRSSSQQKKARTQQSSFELPQDDPGQRQTQVKQQRQAQQRPDRKESARNAGQMSSASASRPRSSSQSLRGERRTVVVADDDRILEQQIEAMNARHSNRARNSPVRAGSGDRSVASMGSNRGPTRARLVCQTEDGAMTIDPQKAQAMAAKLLEQKTKEKLERLQAAARNDPSPQKARQNGPTRKPKTNNQTSNVSPTKSRTSSSGAPIPPVKKSFLGDYLRTIKKGDATQETGYNHTIVLAVGHRLSSKHGVTMTKSELIDAGMFQVSRSIARTHEANHNVDQISDKHFIDEIVQKLLETSVPKNLSQGGGRVTSLGGASNSFLRDYLRALSTASRKDETELNNTITQVVHRRLTSKYSINVTEKDLLVKLDLLTVVRAVARTHEANRTVDITADRTFVDQVARKIIDQHYNQRLDGSKSSRRGARRPKGSVGSRGLNDSTTSETDWSFEMSSHGGQSNKMSKKKGSEGSRGESPRRRNRPASAAGSMSSGSEPGINCPTQQREGSMRQARTATSPRKERPGGPM